MCVCVVCLCIGLGFSSNTMPHKYLNPQEALFQYWMMFNVLTLARAAYAGAQHKSQRVKSNLEKVLEFHLFDESGV